MKKLLLLLLLLAPASLLGQWLKIQDGWQYIQIPNPTASGGSVATDAIWDAAGDLAVGTGADTAAKLTKGADGTLLQVTAGAVGWATLSLTSFATIAANSLVMNATGGAAAPTAIAIPTCADSGGNHLNYSAGAFSCGTSGDGSGAPDPATQETWTDGFSGVCCSSATASGGDIGGWLITNSGTGAGATTPTDAVIDEANHPGVTMITKGSTGTGVSSLNRFMSGTATFRQLLFSANSMYVEFDTCVDALSSDVDTYILREGFGDTVNGTAPTDGAWVEYTCTTGAPCSANWVLKVANNAGPSTTTANVGPTVCPTYQKIRITGTSSAVSVLIDGVAAGTSAVNANIPSAAGREFGLQFSILGTGGSSGAATRAHIFDYIKFSKTVTR